MIYYSLLLYKKYVYFSLLVYDMKPIINTLHINQCLFIYFINYNEL